MKATTLAFIIDRYLAGTATPREAALIRRWLEEKEADHIALDEVTHQAVKATLWEQIAVQTEVSTPVRMVHRARKLLRYAAAVLVLCAGAAGYQMFRRVAVPTPAIVITAMAGQHRKIILSDSSVVYLFPHSVLTIPADYDQQERHLLLQGRGFFEVAPAPARAFSVQTGSVRTQVLGTSFEVAATDAMQATVIVCTGKVQVQEAGRALVNLTPGKRLQYNLQNHSIHIDTVNTRVLGEWRNNVLSFEQASLQEVVSAMNDWYNANIVINNKRWLKESVTIRFKDGTVHDAMRLLSQTLNFRYRETGQQIIIY